MSALRFMKVNQGMVRTSITSFDLSQTPIKSYGELSKK